MKKLALIAILMTALTTATSAQPPTLCWAVNLSGDGWNYHGLYWDSYWGGWYYSASINYSFDCGSGNFSNCWACGQWVSNIASPPNYTSYVLTRTYASSPTGSCGVGGYGYSCTYIYPGIGVLASGNNYSFDFYLQPYDPSTCGQACGPACVDWTITGTDSYSL